MVENIRRNRMLGIDYSVLVSRLGPQGNQQLFSDKVSRFWCHPLSGECHHLITLFLQSIVTLGATVFNVDHGASSFRSMSDDTEQSWQPDSIEFVVRRIQSCDSCTWRCHSIDGLGRLFQVIWTMKHEAYEITPLTTHQMPFQETWPISQIGETQSDGKLAQWRATIIAACNEYDCLWFVSDYETLAHWKTGCRPGELWVLRARRHGATRVEYNANRKCLNLKFFPPDRSFQPFRLYFRTSWTGKRNRSYP